VYITSERSSVQKPEVVSRFRTLSGSRAPPREYLLLPPYLAAEEKLVCNVKRTAFGLAGKQHFYSTPGNFQPMETGHVIRTPLTVQVF